MTAEPNPGVHGLGRACLNLGTSRAQKVSNGFASLPRQSLQSQQNLKRDASIRNGSLKLNYGPDDNYKENVGIKIVNKNTH